jgi:fatty acid CoA ligase FadD9
VGLPIAKSVLPAARFRTAVESVGLEIPHLSAALINKYVSDLRHLQLV